MIGAIGAALSPYMFWLRVAGLAVIFGAGWYAESLRWEAADAARIEAQASADRSAATKAFSETERRLKESQNAQNQIDSDKRRLAAARDVALTERERLRDVADSLSNQLLAASDAEDCRGPTQAAAVAIRVSSECSGRYEALAGDAGDLAGRLAGLQRSIRASCPEAVGQTTREGGRLDE